MKVYVDKLPKECCECLCCNHDVDYGSRCNLGAYEYYEYHQTTTRHNKCPLQTIADHENQVRKQVCDEIRKVCKESQYLSRYTKIDQETLYYVLDQIEKGGQE